MAITEKRNRRLCFTGHRPEKLTRCEWIIKNDLQQQIRQAITEGMNIFISGMARGTDIWAAETVLTLRDAGCPIKLICACPYNGVEKQWKHDWQKRYHDILLQADYVKYICPAYSRDCFRLRNEWMVDHSAKVKLTGVELVTVWHAAFSRLSCAIF